MQEPDNNFNTKKELIGLGVGLLVKGVVEGIKYLLKHKPKKRKSTKKIKVEQSPETV